jgi:hypothetical protein
MDAEARLWQTQQIKGLNRQWMDEDFFKRLGVMYQYGFEVDPVTLRFTKKSGGIVPNTPWCHAKGSHWFSCQFDHHIAFNLFGIIAPRCLNLVLIFIQIVYEQGENDIKMLFNL